MNMDPVNLVTVMITATFTLQLWLTKKIMQIGEDVAVIKQSHIQHSKAINELSSKVENHEHRIIKIESKLGEVYENLNP